MDYKILVKVYQDIGSTTKRLEKTEILAKFLKKLKKEELKLQKEQLKFLKEMEYLQNESNKINVLLNIGMSQDDENEPVVHAQ